MAGMLRFDLLLGAFGLAFLALLLLRALISKHGVVSRGDCAAEVGLDAAEKGSRRSLAEKVPYNLEKRAIMHKRWFMVSHDSQFKKPGDYHTYTIADIPFLIIRGKDKKLRAFHNVCRHRAYTVARKLNGNTPLLACKYHGWQYETTGKLLKAPEFMDKPNFDASANGLFKIHLRLDSGRFVFVNFATKLADAFPWSDISTPIWKSLDFDGAIPREIEVDINWRVASLLPWFVNPSEFVARPWYEKFLGGPQSQNVHRPPRLQYVDDASFICNMGNGSFLLVSALPVDESKTLIKLNHISDLSTSPSAQQVVAQKAVNAELRKTIDVLKKLRASNTNLDLRQSAVRERLDKFARHIDHHKKLEKAAGKKINPALRTSGESMADTEAEEICSMLDGKQDGSLMWCPLVQGEELEW